MKLTFQLGETDNEQIRKIYRMAAADKSCGEKLSIKLGREIGSSRKGGCYFNRVVRESSLIRGHLSCDLEELLF